MLTYQLTITSKNPKALKIFFLFCFQNKKKIFNLTTTFYKKKNETKKFTILKSPHVNKTAQTQLEYRLYSAQIRISLQNASKYLILLKKIKTNLFPELKIKTQLLINKQNKFQLQTKLLNPRNTTLNTLNGSKSKNKSKTMFLKKTLTYIKLLDCFGEINLTQNISLQNNVLFR